MERGGVEGEIRIAIIGRPNVGKSTLVNRLIGEERVIASEQPGTTRDRIFVPFERDGRDFVLIDTAGVRRRSKVDDVIERVSVAKTLQAIDEAHVVIHVVDAHEGIGEQDASVLGLALERGRALLIAVNKWDGIPMEQREDDPAAARAEAGFRAVRAAAFHLGAARHGRRRADGLRRAGLRCGDARDAHAGADQACSKRRSCSTSRRWCVAGASSCVTRTRAARIRRASSCTATRPSSVPEAYSRYLANVFRKAFDLFATPVALEFRTDKNPYSGRKQPERLRRLGGRPATRQETTVLIRSSG